MAVCKRAKGGIRKQHEPGQWKDQQNVPAVKAGGGRTALERGKGPSQQQPEGSVTDEHWCVRSALQERNTTSGYFPLSLGPSRARPSDVQSGLQQR